jgi:hypothetical protein
MKSPAVVLQSVRKMRNVVVEMDTGRYSELAETILFVIRLAIRIEGYFLYLVENKFYTIREVP